MEGDGGHRDADTGSDGVTDFDALHENRRRAFATLLDVSAYLSRIGPEHPDWDRVDLIRDIAVDAFEQAEDALHRAAQFPSLKE